MTLYKRVMTREGYAYDPINIEKKSVDELIAFMPKAFNNDLSLQVAFKEGYNLLVAVIEKKFEEETKE